MTRSSWRHSNQRLIDRIVNGDAQIVADDDPRDYEAAWEMRHDPETDLDRAEDMYEREIERNHP